VLKHQLPNALQLARCEPVGIREVNGLEPYLRRRTSLAHVHVRRFPPFVAVEPEPESLDDQERRHLAFVQREPATRGPPPNLFSDCNPSAVGENASSFSTSTCVSFWEKAAASAS